MKKTLFILCCLIKINLLMASSIHLTDLKCENLINPNGIDNTSPHFSWKIQSKDSKRQEYYEIQVATDSMQLIENKADLWYSGKTPSSTSVMVPYKGNALKSRMLCYWRVRVWNEKGEASDWSNINRFGIGVLENDKLKGDYIGLKSGDVRSPLLRKSFTANPSGVAFLHVNSLGYHEVYINGKKVDDQVLSPAVSQLDKRSLVVTYDVTNYLNQGENELVLWLGQGWYKETTFGAEYNGPVVKAEMNEMKNGKWEPILATENTWTGRESGYSDTGTWKPHQFGGERIDGRLLPRNLSTAELNKLEWFTV